jgi:predicted CXXCH cytochrome family protein
VAGKGPGDCFGSHSALNSRTTGTHATAVVPRRRGVGASNCRTHLSLPYAIRQMSYVLLVFPGCDCFSSPVKGQPPRRVGRDCATPATRSCRAKFSQANVHAPVKLGMCDSCHNPHTARFPKLLAKKGAELCYTCHQDEAAWSQGSVHTPIKEGNCLACHDPHASPNKFEAEEDGRRVVHVLPPEALLRHQAKSSICPSRRAIASNATWLTPRSRRTCW